MKTWRPLLATYPTNNDKSLPICRWTVALYTMTRGVVICPGRERMKIPSRYYKRSVAARSGDNSGGWTLSERENSLEGVVCIDVWNASTGDSA
jgi:hypothetical protein